jgi:hypothetical protein
VDRSEQLFSPVKERPGRSSAAETHGAGFSNIVNFLREILSRDALPIDLVGMTTRNKDGEEKSE